MKKNNYYWVGLIIISLGVLIYWLSFSKNYDWEDSRTQDTTLLKDVDFSWEALKVKEVNSVNLPGDSGEIKVTGGFSK